MHCTKYLRLNDNKERQLKEDEVQSLRKIANVPVKELQKTNPDFLIYPDNSEDQIEDNQICSINSDNIVRTYNLVGFIGVDNLRLTIGSRFDKSEQEHFLLYMLQEVGLINVTDLKTERGKEKIWDFLLYFLFPVLLKKAIRQGVFKRYERHFYNNPNVKGRIDINRHIHENMPFKGNVAYRARELTPNNSVNQLIRHVIEYIQSKGYTKLFSHNSAVINAINTIRDVTPDYSLRDRQKLINTNNRRIAHPYFQAYEPLRKLSRQILMHEHTSFNRNKDQINGVLIDISWLWEEYLNTILQKKGFTHPYNKSQYGGLNLFNDEAQPKIYPDFYSKSNGVVVDAKYKKLNNTNIGREDLYQLITYMYRLHAKKGILLYPNKGELNKNSWRKMHQESCEGTNARLKTLGMHIPQNHEQYENFRDDIKESEEQLLKNFDESGIY